MRLLPAHQGREQAAPSRVRALPTPQMFSVLIPRVYGFIGWKVDLNWYLGYLLSFSFVIPETERRHGLTLAGQALCR